MGVILFLLWRTFLVPSLKNTALIFLEIFSIESWNVSVEPPMTSSLKIQKREYLLKWKTYSKEENAILLCFEKPFFFYFIGTLTNLALFMFHWTPRVLSVGRMLGSKSRSKTEGALYGVGMDSSTSFRLHNHLFNRNPPLNGKAHRSSLNLTATSVDFANRQHKSSSTQCQ